MQTTCVIHGMTDRGESQVLGAVSGTAADVRGAIQQYQKAIGPINSRAAFADMLQQNKGKFQIVNCVPIDVAKV